MATGQTMITRALRIIGAIGQGATPATAQLTEALEALQAMLGQWRNERLLVYAITQVTHTPTGAASYTIGPSGADITATRPVRIEDAFHNDGTYDRPLEVLQLRGEYDRIPDKATQGLPAYVYYLPAMSNGTVYVYPCANSGTLKLNVWTVLPDTIALSDTLALPPGYEEAIVQNLVMAIAPEYGYQPTALQVAGSRAALANIKRSNIGIDVLDLPCDLPGMGRRAGMDAFNQGY